MTFFLLPWIITFLGWGVHVAVDRSPQRRTGRRMVELLLLWVLVFGGIWSLIGALGHLGPNSTEIAEGIGYASGRSAGPMLRSACSASAVFGAATGG